jgi:hypothetical protein
VTILSRFRKTPKRSRFDDADLKAERDATRILFAHGNRLTDIEVIDATGVSWDGLARARQVVSYALDVAPDGTKILSDV